ncbi:MULTISPECIES: hypothetical protein [unclassified Chryseobacterium]|uniref:hypothetical protein n=1 Tax=unclassified Chryseobacterium TaxID=2593645 RepID=UPI0030103F16
MKNTYKYPVLLAAMFLTGFISQTFGQTNSQIGTSKDLVLNFEGNGFNAGTKKLMNFSNSLSKSTHNESSLKDNEITIGKNGLYQVNISGNIHENDQFEQKEEYVIYINGTESLRGYEVDGSPTGIFSFEKELKKGDVLSIGTTMNNEQLKKSTGTNILTIRLLQN